MSSLSVVAVLLPAAIGTLISFYLLRRKGNVQSVPGIFGENCDVVLHSEFARFFSVPVEYLSFAYFLFIAASTLITSLLTEWASDILFFSQLILAGLAFLFALYLTFIQTTTLKARCSWCLMLALAASSIFLTLLWQNNFPLVALLGTYARAVLGVHLVGLALGLGGATVADLFFFKFLADRKISPEESRILHTVSQVVWAGLFILILSGIGLYLPYGTALLQNPKFLLKLLVVSVITINGAFLNLYMAPKLVYIYFGQHHTRHTRVTAYDRRLAFALGAVSATSWYTALILGLVKQTPWNFPTLLLMYLGALCIAITGSQVLEFIVGRRSLR